MSHDLGANAIFRAYCLLYFIVFRSNVSTVSVMLPRSLKTTVGIDYPKYLPAWDTSNVGSSPEISGKELPFSEFKERFTKINIYIQKERFIPLHADTPSPV